MASNDIDVDMQWQGVAPSQPTENINRDTDNLEDQVKIRYAQDTKFRHHLSVWVMLIVPIWMGFVLLLIASNGFGWTCLSDTALVALLTTTTANVLGLAYIVLKGIFPESKDK